MMSKDFSHYWKIVKEKTLGVFELMRDLVIEYTQVWKNHLTRRLRITENLNQRIKARKGAIPLPDGAKVEYPQPLPKGVKILHNAPDMVKLRFFSFRGFGFLFGLAVLMVIPLLTIALTFIFNANDNPIPEMVFFAIALTVSFLIWSRPRVVVQITKDWMRFGNKYYDMRFVKDIRGGGLGESKGSARLSLSIFQNYKITYGAFNGQTMYMNSTGRMIERAMLLNELIKRITEGTNAHGTEYGKREQKF